MLQGAPDTCKRNRSCINRSLFFHSIDVSVFWKVSFRFLSLIAIVLFFCQAMISCSGEKELSFYEFVQVQDEKDDSVRWLYNWPPDSLVSRSFSGKEIAQRRALQMATIKWTPKYEDIPSRYGFYEKDKTYIGIPYSLAIKTDSHVGTQVSLYTYMTAVDNPASVLYTEDLRESPYYGFDCAPYYGTTCSNSVLFALGIEPPYYSYMFRSIPGMIKPKEQKPQDIEVCDVLLKTGHVVMVYDIIKDSEGSISKVRIFETTSVNQKDTWIRSFTFEEFEEYWKKNDFVRLQYKYLDNNTDYEPLLFAPLVDEPDVDYNRSLKICTSRGDRASYLFGQDVKIAVFSKNYSQIKLYKDGELFHDEEITAPVMNFKDLPYGLYKAYLSTREGRKSSDYTSFEVIDASVTGKKDDSIRISFSSKNASARYMCICDGDQNPSGYFQFDDKNREQGYFEVKAVEGTRNDHFKVYFKGQYGMVSTQVKRF